MMMTHKYYGPRYKISRHGDLAIGVYAPLLQDIVSSRVISIEP